MNSITSFTEGLSLHAWAVLIAGIFVLIALSFSFHLMFQHLTTYTNPEEQKWLLGVLFMVPVYSVESLVSLGYPKLSLACDILRNCYEAFALYSFGRYLIACLGGDDKVIDSLEEQAISGPQMPLLTHSLGKAAVKHPFPFNLCLSPWHLGKNFYDIFVFGIVQYMILKTLCSLIALILEVVGSYGDGEFKWNKGYPYVALIINFSQMWALYCLVQFYTITKNELHHIKPLAKFLSFKAIVFATWWQGVAIAIVFDTGLVKVRTSTAGDLKPQASLQDFIISIEMAIAAIAHIYIFPATPYKPINELVQDEVPVLPYIECMDSVPENDKDKKSIVNDVENVATTLKESVQDVVLVGGEQVVSDIKVTVSQAVQPMEKGINRINETLQQVPTQIQDTLQQLPDQLPWKVKEGEVEKRGKDDFWLSSTATKGSPPKEIEHLLVRVNSDDFEVEKSSYHLGGAESSDKSNGTSEKK